MECHRKTVGRKFELYRAESGHKISALRSIGNQAGALKRRSVSAAQLAVYDTHVLKFVDWSLSRRLHLWDDVSLDLMLARYMDELFAAGESPSRARNTLYGLSFVYDRDLSKARCPRAHRCLKGFVKLAPEREVDPMPWKACLALADDMLKHCWKDKLAAAALLIQFDVYARPSEVLGLNFGDLIPSGPRGPIAVVVRPANGGQEGDNADLRQAQHGLARNRPAKNGTFDGSVLVGEAASARGGRGLVFDLVQSLEKLRMNRHSKVFPLTLAQYATCLSRAGRRLNIQTMRLTPHTARHGGASEDYFQKLRDIRSIQARGRWEAPRSTARYKKPGKLCRQIAEYEKLCGRCVTTATVWLQLKQFVAELSRQ